MFVNYLCIVVYVLLLLFSCVHQVIQFIMYICYSLLMYCYIAFYAPCQSFFLHITIFFLFFIIDDQNNMFHILLPSHVIIHQHLFLSWRVTSNRQYTREEGILRNSFIGRRSLQMTLTERSFISLSWYRRIALSCE